jgi:hypothetical protein
MPSKLNEGKIQMKTPYENHTDLNHHLTRYSPNGVDIIEECDDCPARFLHNPSIGYPVSLSPLIKTNNHNTIYAIKG